MESVSRIKAFVDVVDNEGYSSAARHSGRSKALLSKYVRELEDDLGVLLLNRTTRQFSLTEAGEAYYRSSIQILRQLEEAREAVRNKAADVEGTLRLTAPRALGSVEAMLPLTEFAKAYPYIKMEVTLDDRKVDIVEERFDVAIRVSVLSDSTLIAKKLYPNIVLCCVSPEFLKTRRVPDHPSQIADWPAIVDTNRLGRNSWIFVDKDGQKFTQTVRSVMDVNAPEVSKRAVMAGLGVSMLPKFAIEQELAEGRIISILEPFMPEGSAFYAVFPDRRHISAKVRAFVDFMDAWFKKGR